MLEIISFPKGTMPAALAAPKKQGSPCAEGALETHLVFDKILDAGADGMRVFIAKIKYIVCSIIV